MTVHEPVEIHGIPHPLGFPTGAQIAFGNLDFDHDAVLSGVRVLLYASDEMPYQRMLAKVTKDQLDTSPLPGDASLEGWWTRSQTDWSGGSGQDFMEPITDEQVARKFKASAGVDVFTEPGWVSLLPSAFEIDSSPATSSHLCKVPGGFAYSFDQYVYLNTGVSADFGEPVTSLQVAGSCLVVGLTDTAKVVECGTLADRATISGFTGVPVVSWVKGRMMFMVGDKVWEIPGAPTSDIDLSDATAHPVKVDMKDPSWTFVGATSSPTSILLAGHGNSGSAVLALKLDETGKLPDLTAPTEVAQLPVSEQITGITTYLGTFIAILTNRGVRVGVTADTGLAYGPLLGAPASTGDGGDVSVYDRFVFYPIADAGDGRGGMAIVDLSEADQADGRNAWSTWIRVPETDAGFAVTDSIVLDPHHVVMIGEGNGEIRVYEAKPENGLDSGWLTTSLVRFGTLETKTYESVKVLAGQSMDGKISVDFVGEYGKESQIGILTAAMGSEASFDVNSRAPHTEAYLKFRLEPDTLDPKAGPRLAAWTMRAWPSVENRGEQIVLPILCFDYQRDNRGLQFGYEGYAHDLWKTLASRLTNGQVLIIDEVRSGFSYKAIAEDMTFTQVSPPSHASGFGGIIQVKLRTT